MQNISIKYISNSGYTPVYSSTNASGADIQANVKETLIIAAGDFKIVPTGLFLEIPEGFEAQIRPRSGLAAKHGITVLNTPGTIDSDYRGEIKIILINHGKQDFAIKKGDRIAQMVIAPVVQAVFTKKDSLNNTERGDGGFGSTGISE